MGDQTKIEWADATWNPIVGCTVVSPGCTNCYAMRLAARLERMGQPHYAGLTQPSSAGPVWTGEIRSAPDSVWAAPSRWKRPRRIFVHSMGDLFHPAVPDALVMRVWLIMGSESQHTYLILTKRPDRMRAWLERWSDLTGESAGTKLARGPDAVRAAHPSGRGQLFAEQLETMRAPPPGRAYPLFDWYNGPRFWPYVLPNVWLGTSAEDQKRLDERAPHLLRTPAALHFVSFEPLLGPIDARIYMPNQAWNDIPSWQQPQIRWAIAGLESGPGARATHLDAVRSLRDQCADAGVPFYLKRLGEWAPAPWKLERQPGETDKSYKQRSDAEGATHAVAPWTGSFQKLSHAPWSVERSAGAPAHFQGLRRVGKRAAGDLLDGLQHHAFPA